MHKTRKQIKIKVTPEEVLPIVRAIVFKKMIKDPKFKRNKEKYPYSKLLEIFNFRVDKELLKVFRIQQERKKEKNKQKKKIYEEKLKKELEVEKLRIEQSRIKFMKFFEKLEDSLQRKRRGFTEDNSEDMAGCQFVSFCTRTMEDVERERELEREIERAEVEERRRMARVSRQHLEDMARLDDLIEEERRATRQKEAGSAKGGGAEREDVIEQNTQKPKKTFEDFDADRTLVKEKVKDGEEGSGEKVPEYPKEKSKPVACQKKFVESEILKKGVEDDNKLILDFKQKKKKKKQKNKKSKKIKKKKKNKLKE